jgi:hypothetical protein
LGVRRGCLIRISRAISITYGMEEPGSVLVEDF